MFGFLRARRSASSVLRAPLRAAGWDGRVLTLTFDAAVAAQIALDLDGCFFSAAAVEDDLRAHFAFAFAPGGRPVFDVWPRLGRDGAPLALRPLRLRFGSAGVQAAPVDALPAALAALTTAAHTVPFGLDTGNEVAVVVPVYNAPELVERCLESVLAHTTGPARLIVVDDAGPDPDIAPLLAKYAGVNGVSVVRHETNRGFTASANRGIAEAGAADVVLLNADAEVGPNWLTGLRRAAYSHGDVATATAVSDNAGAFSVPELEQANALPACWTFDETARSLWQQAGLAYPALPTGNGFCLYIRRAVIDAVGLLDEAAFAQGYGEENDFCQRASRRGLQHVIAGNVLVRHARSRSFGEQRRIALGRAGMNVLRERYPDYESAIQSELFSFERRVIDWRVRRVFAAARSGFPPRPRVLWVGAGAPDWGDVEVWNLRANGVRNELVRGNDVVAANTWKADDAEASYRALWDWLQIHAIECLVLTQRSGSVAEILCSLLGIAVVQVDAAVVASATAGDFLRRARAASRSFPERSA